jgi:hypothetical protein
VIVHFLSADTIRDSYIDHNGWLATMAASSGRE